MVRATRAANCLGDINGGPGAFGGLTLSSLSDTRTVVGGYFRVADGRSVPTCLAGRRADDELDWLGRIGLRACVGA